MYQEWITKEKLVKFRSLYIKCSKLRSLCIKSGSPKKKLLSCGIYISSVQSCVLYVSRVDNQRKRCQVSESVYQDFKVALSMYFKCSKLRSLCIKSGLPLCIKSGLPNKKLLSFRVSTDIKCLKLRCLCIKSGSPKKKLLSCGVFISSV